MTALCALVLADRGELDLDAPVATYWPEFAANGKENVLVRHLLSHTAGSAGLGRADRRSSDLYDWEKGTVAARRAGAVVGAGHRQSGYHAVTQGYLVGEVIRRVERRVARRRSSPRRSPGRSAPTSTSARPPEHDDRVAARHPARRRPPAWRAPSPSSTASARTMSPTRRSTPQRRGTIPWRRAEIPAAGGHGNARSVAPAQSVRLATAARSTASRCCREAGVDRIFDEQANGTDLVLGAPLTLGIGYGLNSPSCRSPQRTRACFWGGWGGSLVVNDLDARMTVAYVMNRMGEGTTGDDRAGSLLMLFYAALASTS